MSEPDQRREDMIASCFSQGIDPHAAFGEFEDDSKGYGEQDQDHNAEEEEDSWSEVDEEDVYGSMTEYVVYDRNAIDSLDD